jgi:hypothetical protein
MSPKTPAEDGPRCPTCGDWISETTAGDPVDQDYRGIHWMAAAEPGTIATWTTSVLGIGVAVTQRACCQYEVWVAGEFVTVVDDWEHAFDEAILTAGERAGWNEGKR